MLGMLGHRHWHTMTPQVGQHPTPRAEGATAGQRANGRGARGSDTQLVSLLSQSLAEALELEQGQIWTEDLQV